MTNSEQAIREFQRKYAMKTYRLNPETLQREQTGYDVNFISDLTALISEHYVSREDAGYPLEFIEWLIKDQEIFFGELNEEYILNDNIHVGGRKLQTIDELFAYWKENEQ